MPTSSSEVGDQQSLNRTTRHFGCVTLFPEMFSAITQQGVCGRAVKRGLVEVTMVNPRDFTADRHRTVDDRPYGGGPGMLMMAEPLQHAINEAKTFVGAASKAVYLSPQGKPMNQALVEELSQHSGLVLVCGRYEGIDERVIESSIDIEVSLGDFVLSGGEIAAMALMDAMIRLMPDVLGHEQSAQQDSFNRGLLDYPHYTRPEVLAGNRVPSVLLSGDHAAIAKWRLKQSLGRTWMRRPELLDELNLSEHEQQLLHEFQQETLKN